MRAFKPLAALALLCIAAPLGTTSHVVRRGETLGGIAAAHGTTVAALVRTNGLSDPDRIVAGRELNIPGGTAAAPPAAASSTTEHRIRAGETLGSIARRYGTSVRALVEANSLNSAHLIVAGRTLKIPGGPNAAPPAAAPKPAAPAAPQQRTHTVRRGETLSVIARTYGTSVRSIVEANSLSSAHLIVAGRTLKIPGAGPSGTSRGAAPSTPPPAPATKPTHTVSSGETLGAIARRYGTTAAAIANENELRSLNFIRIGQRLRIPVSVPGLSSTSAVPSKLAANPDRLALLRHFDAAAARFGVPHDLLKAMTWLESGWQQGVVSHVGARGVGQLMPATVEFMNRLIPGPALDPNRVEDNIMMSARYLRWLLDQTGGDESMALAGYYQGLAGVRRHGVFNVTRTYVEGILALRQRYAWR